MFVIAFNGSPRKAGATSTLLNKALEGAASQGVKVEFVQLSQFKMRGCRGCFSCKKRGGKSYGKCVIKDDMTALYKKMERADALFFGTPFYFHSITFEMTMLIERLYPYFSYEHLRSIFPNKINVGLIYTMGADDEQMKMWYRRYIKRNQFMMALLFGSAETLISTDTPHVADYSQIVADGLAPVVERKLRHREQVFPLDCATAFDLGVKFASRSKTAHGDDDRSAYDLLTGKRTDA